MPNKKKPGSGRRWRGHIRRKRCLSCLSRKCRDGAETCNTVVACTLCMTLMRPISMTHHGNERYHGDCIAKAEGREPKKCGVHAEETLILGEICPICTGDITVKTVMPLNGKIRGVPRYLDTIYNARAGIVSLNKLTSNNESMENVAEEDDDGGGETAVITRVSGGAGQLVNSHYEENGANQLIDEMTGIDEGWFTDDDNGVIDSDEEGDSQHPQYEEKEKMVLVGMPPLRRHDNTPCQYINPYFGDNTCQGAEKSSLFWLDQIKEVYVHFSLTSNMQLFVEDMISQPHACLHKDYHRTIINALKDVKGDHKLRYPPNICTLSSRYKMINKTFVCTCGSWIIPETQEDEIRRQMSIPLQFEQNSDPCKYVNPYLGDTTCQGAKKSSLFWLDKIREVYNNPNCIQDHYQRCLFVDNMISQAHACLHKDYHKAIINGLMAGKNDGKIRFPQNIMKLMRIYKKLNKTFVCTCRVWVPHNTLETHESRDTPDSHETEEDDDLETDLTYDDILDVLGLDD